LVAGRGFTSVSVTACRKMLFCPLEAAGSAPPLLQSYDTAYAKMLPSRLNPPPGLPLTPGCQIGYMDRTCCHKE
jgi:hypothetical protein